MTFQEFMQENGYRGSEKEGQVFCDMITERIEKYEKRMSYDKGKLNN